MKEIKVKVRKYTLRANGPYGYMVAVPTEWVEDMGKKVRDTIAAFRTVDNKLFYEFEEEV